MIVFVVTSTSGCVTCDRSLAPVNTINMHSLLHQSPNRELAVTELGSEVSGAPQRPVCAATVRAG